MRGHLQHPYPLHTDKTDDQNVSQALLHTSDQQKVNVQGLIEAKIKLYTSERGFCKKCFVQTFQKLKCFDSHFSSKSP